MLGLILSITTLNLYIKFFERKWRVYTENFLKTATPFYMSLFQKPPNFFKKHYLKAPVQFLFFKSFLVSGNCISQNYSKNFRASFQNFSKITPLALLWNITE